MRKAEESDFRELRRVVKRNDSEAELRYVGCKSEHTQGGMIKLTANVTAGSDFVQDLQGSPGRYKVVASPEHYQADCLTLLSAVSKQFAQAIRKAQ